jgi:hypothetical protein
LIFIARNAIGRSTQSAKIRKRRCESLPDIEFEEEDEDRDTDMVIEQATTTAIVSVGSSMEPPLRWTGFYEIPAAPTSRERSMRENFCFLHSNPMAAAASMMWLRVFKHLYHWTSACHYTLKVGLRRQQFVSLHSAFWGYVSTADEL